MLPSRLAEHPVGSWEPAGAAVPVARCHDQHDQPGDVSAALQEYIIGRGRRANVACATAGDRCEHGWCERDGRKKQRGTSACSAAVAPAQVNGTHRCQTV